MDKKHNNLAQPETEWMYRSSAIKDAEAINPDDHPGVKLNNNNAQNTMEK